MRGIARDGYGGRELGWGAQTCKSRSRFSREAWWIRWRRKLKTASNLKPGMVASLGVGAATGGIGMAAAIGGGMAVASEALLVSVEKDAKRAAKAVADRVIQGYKDRGWLKQ